ncbi:MAG: hypothetical protein RL127_1462 [Bacteroidota bacterium]
MPMRALVLFLLIIMPGFLLAQKRFVRIQLPNANELVGQFQSEDDRKIQLLELNLGPMQVLKSQIQAQDELGNAIRIEIQLNDNRTLVCELRELSADQVQAFSKDLGNLAISRANVKSLRYLPVVAGGQAGIQFDNPHPTRYFFGPSAIPLKKGERYYQNAYVLANSVQYGINDNFSIGGGAVIPFAFFITPKWGYQVASKWHLGYGMLAATSFIKDMNFGLAVAYGSATYGTKEHNVTLNAGWGAVKQQDPNSSYAWRGARRPMFTISAMTRISNRVMLVTENWLFSLNEYDFQTETYTMKNRGILTGGFRFMGEKNSFDFGVLVPSGEAVAIPYIDYVFKF